MANYLPPSLPHLTVRVGASAVYTQNLVVNNEVAAHDSYHKVKCNVSPGNSRFRRRGPCAFNDPRNNAADNQIVESGVGNCGGWTITAKMDSSGSVYGYALCGKAAVELVQ